MARFHFSTLTRCPAALIQKRRKFAESSRRLSQTHAPQDASSHEAHKKVSRHVAALTDP
jgi:hypothetical protein